MRLLVAGNVVKNHDIAGKGLQAGEAMRHVVSALHKNFPQASEREIAKLADCSRGVVQKVFAKIKSSLPLKDAPRSGRPKSLQGEALTRAIQIGVESPVGCSRGVCEQLTSEGFPAVHPSTVCRSYRRAGVRYGSAKRGLLITERNRAARIAFATKHGAGGTDFKGIMFTNSKIFVLDQAGGKIWYVGGKRPTMSVPKSSIKVHVYFGVTYLGNQANICHRRWLTEEQGDEL